MDRIVKIAAVLTVQLQRDVTIQQENVLMDARLGGNSQRVIRVRHVPSFKQKYISID